MKVCISLRDASPQNLKAGNLRSEARWERQALEACISNASITEIYTAGCEWHDGADITAKYKGVAPPNKVSDMILLMQDWNSSIINYGFKAAIVNIFHGPWLEQQNEVLDLCKKYGGRIWLTIGFPVLFRAELGIDTFGRPINRPLPSLLVQHAGSDCSHLTKFVSRDHIINLPVPAAPYVVEQDNFNKNTILWCCRLVFMSQMQDAVSLSWALQQLRSDPTLNLEVVTGWSPTEVRNYVDGQVITIGDITEAFWDLPTFQPFKDVRNRVAIHLDLNWDDVLNKYSNAKLMVTYGKQYGGPGIECGMHGVPFVSSGVVGALADCPDYLHAPSEKEACYIFDRLMTDHDFYVRIAKSYRKYTDETYTYAAFNYNINKLLSDNGLL